MDVSKSLGVVVIASLWLLPTVAGADWDPGDPAKWVQLPDPDGWDVRDVSPLILADDFECTETTWVTDIHLWSSWWSDAAGSITWLRLSIHADVPADQSGTGYSIPGAELWSREIEMANYPGASVRYYGKGDQGWYNPSMPPSSASAHDHTGIWQVNLALEPEDRFLQTGTAATPVTYWLGIQANVEPAPGSDVVNHGWKTSLDHWGDTAVWGEWGYDEPKPEGDEWSQLLDPATGAPLDMAFVLTAMPIPEPRHIVLLGFCLIGLSALRRRAAIRRT
jgi:hypothetical protein